MKESVYITKKLFICPLCNLPILSGYNGRTIVWEHAWHIAAKVNNAVARTH